MTEATITSQLVVYLQGYPSNLVKKLSDRYTFGIPDVVVACNGITTWLEIKRVREAHRELLAERSFKVQLHEMERFARHARAAYVVFVGKQKIQSTELWRPIDLRYYVLERDMKAGERLETRRGKAFDFVQQYVSGEDLWTT